MSNVLLRVRWVLLLLLSLRIQREVLKDIQMWEAVLGIIHDQGSDCLSPDDESESDSEYEHFLGISCFSLL
jgi:hypothetical protein